MKTSNSSLSFEKQIQNMIIYEDENMIVLNKKENISVYPPTKNKLTIYDFITSLISSPDTFDEPQRAGIIHRLDKMTSGLMLLAKTPIADRILKKQFQKRKIHKQYLTIVRGIIYKPHDIINKPISSSHHFRKKRVDQKEDGKEAITQYSVVIRGNNETLLKVILHTGRTHQIRVHMNHIGYPILGDTLYGRDGKETHLYLFSQKISFTHPLTLKKLSFKINPPDFFQEKIDTLNLK